MIRLVVGVLVLLLLLPGCSTATPCTDAWWDAGDWIGAGESIRNADQAWAEMPWELLVPIDSARHQELQLSASEARAERSVWGVRYTDEIAGQSATPNSDREEMVLLNYVESLALHFQATLAVLNNLRPVDTSPQTSAKLETATGNIQQATSLASMLASKLRATCSAPEPSF